MKISSISYRLKLSGLSGHNDTCIKTPVDSFILIVLHMMLTPFWDVFIIIRHFFRYQTDFSEDSSFSKAEPFTLAGVLRPPSQATTRTSQNVSFLTILISK